MLQALQELHAEHEESQATILELEAQVAQLEEVSHASTQYTVCIPSIRSYGHGG